MSKNKEKNDVLDLEKMNFERALEKLQKIVEELEKGGLSLDQTLKEFNQGMQLLKFCNQKLDKAEKEIKLMVKENDEFKEEVFFDSEVEED